MLASIICGLFGNAILGRAHALHSITLPIKRKQSYGRARERVRSKRLEGFETRKRARRREEREPEFPFIELSDEDIDRIQEEEWRRTGHWPMTYELEHHYRVVGGRDEGFRVMPRPLAEVQNIVEGPTVSGRAIRLGWTGKERATAKPKRKRKAKPPEEQPKAHVQLTSYTVPLPPEELEKMKAKKGQIARARAKSRKVAKNEELKDMQNTKAKIKTKMQPSVKRKELEKPKKGNMSRRPIQRSHKTAKMRESSNARVRARSESRKSAPGKKSK